MATRRPGARSRPLRPFVAVGAARLRGSAPPRRGVPRPCGAAFPAHHQGAAGGLTFLARTLGVVTGVAILAAVFAGRREIVGFQPAFAEAFTLAALAVAVAAVAGLAVGRAAPYTLGR